MTQKIALFLLFPFFVFGTIEVATKTEPSKEVAEKVVNPNTSEEAKKDLFLHSPSEKRYPGRRSLQKEDNETLPEPEATTPPFLDSGYQKQFFRTLIFICVLIAFFLIVIYIYKRGSPMSKITQKNSKNNIKILERRSLSPQTYLYHVQVGDKQFILSESKVEVRSVATLDWPERK